MSARTVTLPPLEPEIRSGPLVAMKRTDGQIAIVDERRPIGERTLRVVATEIEAREAVRELAP